MGLDRLLNLSAKIKDGSYLPSPVSQIMIPKPGKKKVRPLGIPAYDDKLISEAMRMILNAIYDPIFEKVNVSHGFRPNRSTHSAVNKIQYKTQGQTLTINGDLDAAYQSVNHEILISILEERIHDKKFLDLVWKFCRAGLYNFNTQKLEQTLLGVPQGQIASPIIFNIYFHKFDEFVIQLLDSKTTSINKTRNIKQKLETSRIASGRKTQALPCTTYSTLNNNIYRTNKRLNELKQRNVNIPFNEWTDTDKKVINQLNTQITNKKAERSKLLYSDKSEIQIQYYYIRYADDWILFTNGKIDFAEQIKTELSIFLSDTLKMSLSTEKTRIIDITKEPTRFLGFAIGTLPKTQSHTREIKLFINPDFDRIISRLHLKSHCDPDGFPRESPALSTQNDDTIIEQCNSIMEGLINYYYPVITSVHQLQRIGYILQYSAYKTLAQKHKTSVRKILQLCGGPKKPLYPLEYEGRVKHIPIHDYYWLIKNRLNLTETRNTYQYSKSTSNYSYEIDTDFLTRTKANWRTKRTLYTLAASFVGPQKTYQAITSEAKITR